jgi:hypothetical protein
MNPGNSTQALGQVQATQKAAQDPNTILANQQKAMGVNQAEQTVTGLRGAIDNTTKLLSQVAPSVMGRTANSLVTNAQANRQIQNEQAPISANLTKETGDYNNATSDLNNLEQKAQTAASGIYQGQQDKLSYAQNLYNTLFGREQAAQQAKQQASAAAEQKRQFNADLAEKQREANRSSGSGGGSGLGSGSSSSFGSQQRADKGFNFQDANGNPTNAVNYSRANGVQIRTQLQRMAKASDKGAKTALNYVGNDYGINIPKLKSLGTNTNTYTKTVNLLRSLGFSLK